MPEFNNIEYNKWKKNNVSYRGIKELGVFNGSLPYESLLGEGLYSVPKSNISMAKKYGEVYILVNAIPKKPKIFDTLNDWQIWFQYNILSDYNMDKRKFNKETTIRTEMLKLGYDGVIIKGREMVNYTPEDVIYFQTEKQLIHYYEINVLENQ